MFDGLPALFRYSTDLIFRVVPARVHESC